MKSRLLALSLTLLLNLPAAAQSSAKKAADQPMAAPSGDVTIVQVIAGGARPGSEAQYMEGRKRHIEFHRSQNDAWSYHAYQVISGEQTGSFVTVTSPHKWSDQDARDQFNRDDQADVMKNILPYAGHTEVSYWRVRSDMSRAGAPKADDPPAPYYAVSHFILHADALPGFIDNVKRASAAADKVNAPGPSGLWYQLANGGEGPHFVLVTPRKTWAEFNAPPIDDVLKQALGAEGATLISNIRKAFARTWTETIQHRDDLSYHPAGK